MPFAAHRTKPARCVKAGEMRLPELAINGHGVNGSRELGCIKRESELAVSFSPKVPQNID